MGETEIKIKEMIIENYGSLKNFCETIEMPWSTLDSILKRGFSNSNITNVMKITKELNIDTEKLASGTIEATRLNEKNEYFFENNIYFSFAKEAEQNGIDPDDIRLALDTIKQLRRK